MLGYSQNLVKYRFVPNRPHIAWTLKFSLINSLGTCSLKMSGFRNKLPPSPSSKGHLAAITEVLPR